MSNVKVSLFQKNINTELTRDQKTKLAQQKSDFLILPRFFPFLDGWSSDQDTKEKRYLDKILEISEYHKGVVIGGSIFRKRDGKWIESYPIVQDVKLIDYYDVRSNDSLGSIQITGTEGDSIFILGGIRFAILPGKDLENESFLKKISEEKIELVLNPASPLMNARELETYQADLERYAALSIKYNLQIVRCAGMGKFGEYSFSGRSFYTEVKGVRWKVAPFENNTEIIKTVNVSILDNLP